MAALFKRKEKSLEDFLINRFGKPLYEMFFEDYTEKVWGVSPKLISPSWGAQRIKGLSLMKALKTILFKPFNKNKKKIETSLIEEFYYPKYGPGHMYEHMCELIKNMGGEVRLNHRVVKINLKGSRVESVIVSTPEGNQELKGDYFVSTMPIKDLVGAMKETMTKPEILPLADGLIYRDFITVGVLVPKLKIKNKTKIKTLGDVVPDCWIYIQEKDVKVGRLQVFNNWSPYMVKDPEHTVWVGMEYFVNVGDALWEMKEDKFRQFAIQELVKIGILDESTHVLDSVQVKVEKAYPAYFGTYDRFEEIRQYLDSVKNLYCIGRNGQHRYNNMDHSMMTAIVTVESI
jgi:protoporphyrinogen oxidase